MRKILFTGLVLFALSGPAGAAAAGSHTLWLPPAGVGAAEVNATIQRCTSTSAKGAARRAEMTTELLKGGVTNGTRDYEDTLEQYRRACLKQSSWQEIKLTDAQFAEYQKLADEPARIAYLKAAAN